MKISFTRRVIFILVTNNLNQYVNKNTLYLNCYLVQYLYITAAKIIKTVLLKVYL